MTECPRCRKQEEQKQYEEQQRYISNLAADPAEMARQLFLLMSDAWPTAARLAKLEEKIAKLTGE